LIRFLPLEEIKTILRKILPKETASEIIKVLPIFSASPGSNFVQKTPLAGKGIYECDRI